MSSQIANKIKIKLYFVSNKFSILFAKFRVSPLTNQLKQQQFDLIVIIPYTYFAYTITFLQQIFITEIFKTQLLSSHVTCLHTRLIEFFLNCLCLLHVKQSNECNGRRMSLFSRNLYKCKQATCSVIIGCLFVYTFFYVWLLFCCCLFTFLSPFFILMLLLYFCLFVHHVNKLIIFVCVYHFHFRNNRLCVLILYISGGTYNLESTPNDRFY